MLSLSLSPSLSSSLWSSPSPSPSSWLPSARTRRSLAAVGTALCLTLLASACATAGTAPQYAGKATMADTSLAESETRAERVLFAQATPAEPPSPDAAAAGAGAAAGDADDYRPGAPAPTPTNIATTPSTAEPQLKKALVVEGWISLEVNEVPDTAKAVADKVQEMGGTIVNEQLSGGERSWSGYLKLKLPPERVPEFLDWLTRQGDITSKRIQGTDVSRTLFDQEIALDNLQRTLDRMRKLLDREGLDMKDILAIEREMTRLRGEIERIKGEKRFLEHRVALATLDINLRHREGVILGRAKAKFYPGARLSALYLVDPEGREQVRMGGGVVIHTIPRLTLELDIFERVNSEPRAVVATFGGSTYSDFLGRGRNRFLNPYLGLRLGYGYLDGSAFVFAGSGGVELFKHEYALIDATVNVLGFARSDFDVAVTGSLSAVFAF